MKGRKPKPTALKGIEGNPGRRPLNDREPTPPDGMPECPDFLDDVARAKWDETVVLLNEMGLMSKADGTALAAFCTTFSRWVHAENQVKQFGTIVKSPAKGFPMKSPYLTVADQAMETMRKFMVEFGLTPSSRSRIKVPQNTDAADEFDVFLDAAG